MAKNVDIQKKNNESPTSLLRRFSRLSKNIGFMREVRKRRYFDRKPSALRKKRSAMARIEGAKKYEEAYKMGNFS